MEKTSVRTNGNQFPAYVNGRPRAMLIDAFRPAPADNVVPMTFAEALHTCGALISTSVSSDTIYLNRGKKKVLVPAAA